MKAFLKPTVHQPTRLFLKEEKTIIKEELIEEEEEIIEEPIVIKKDVTEYNDDVSYADENYGVIESSNESVDLETIKSFNSTAPTNLFSSSTTYNT